MREGNPKRERPRERVRPTRQRHLTARCIGLRYINVNQSPKAEEMWDYADYKAEYMRGLLDCAKSYPKGWRGSLPE